MPGKVLWLGQSGERAGEAGGSQIGRWITIALIQSETSWKAEIHTGTLIIHAKLLEPSFKSKRIANCKLTDSTWSRLSFPPGI